MRKFLIIVVFLASTYNLFGNAAQPGIFGAGAFGKFYLFFPEDSIYFKKIQMQQEFITVNLYNGFAVVKGQYWMYNHENDTISMKVGYPLNATYIYNQSHEATEIRFDALYKLKVKINGTDQELLQLPDTLAIRWNSLEQMPNYDNTAIDWYIWETTFAPKSATKIEVWFIVNTNESLVRLGYNNKRYNGFIYVLETGSIWKNPIEKGRVYIQFKDDILLDNIHGIKPDSIFGIDNTEKNLLYDFSNLTPGFDDNIIITYGSWVENFNWENIIEKYEEYYSEIDKSSNTKINKSDFELTKFDDPYEIGSTWWVSLLMFLFFFVIYGIPILVVLTIVIVIVVSVKKKKKKSEKLADLT
ncbi:MAG: hypothetical protein DRJ10_12590 [Bacteroidetes bacterium]|nr:MAG: hypothetical protein DRJ10_12590 [Bacteroidota bacterium]